jgi:predicted ATPase
MADAAMPAEPNPVPPRIKTVTIEGFRSLRNIRDLALPQLTVLIGANGSGKSTLIRFFEMLSWMLKSKNLQEFVLRQGGGDDQFFMGARKTPRIHVELCLETAGGDNEYRFDLVHVAAGDRLMVMNEAYRFSDRNIPGKASWTELGEVSKESGLPGQTNRTATTITKLLQQCSTYQFHDTSANAAIHNRWDVTESFRLRSDGGNLAAVLLDLGNTDPMRYEFIRRQIRRVLPGFKDFVLEPQAGKVLLRWIGEHSDKVFGSHLSSDGSLRLFCLLTLLNLPPERLPDVLFFDEPELGLHPHAITLVSAMFRRLASFKQVFIATQSPYMVDCFALEDIIVADCKGGETSLRNLPAEQYRQWLEEDYLLSDLWLKTPIGDP